MDASLRLLVKVAYLYYVSQQRQETIAQSLSLSRSTVSRMLAEARERGLVEITINYPPETNIHLERLLEESFDLQEAIVVPDTLGVPSGEGQQVADAAATYLSRILRSGDVIGVSGGTTLARVARALRGFRARDLTVVQLIGQTAIGHDTPVSLLNDYDVTRSFANALGARFYPLPAPAFTEQRAIGEALRAEPMVRQILETGRRANVAVVGIGAIGASSHLVQGSLLTVEDTQCLVTEGAVGEICARFFDIDGCARGAAFEQRIIGVTLRDLQACPVVVGIAYGEHKVPSIVGALRSHAVKVLITDEETARHVLRLAPRPALLAEARGG
jgi:deoxyribonucleoside regulator